jgi:ornithine cyclodeaminase/alanine dehydrogenase
LAARTLKAAAEGRAQAPPKPAIHPRPGAFLHAMPAYLEEIDAVALKWVAGYPTNPERGLPYIHGIVIVNDADTGLPVAIMDAAVLTAARTAAVSAVCAGRWGPPGWTRLGIIGVGVQGRSHAQMLKALYPTAVVRGYDPAGFELGFASPAPTATEAARGADVLVTAVPMQRKSPLVIDREDLPDRWLILPVDFDATLDPGIFDSADAFFVDDLEQYRYYRDQGWFADWPDPDGSVGVELAPHRPSPGRVVCVNLGLGALDAAFADLVERIAAEQDVGTVWNL